jgi:hypothetical protein
MKKQEAEKMCAELRRFNPDFVPTMEGIVHMHVKVIAKQIELVSSELKELQQIVQGKTIRFNRSGANVRMVISDL